MPFFSYLYCLLVAICIVSNAPQAAALRELADFILAFCFHFSSLNNFPYQQNPHCGCPQDFSLLFPNYLLLPKYIKKNGMLCENLGECL